MIQSTTLSPITPERQRELVRQHLGHMFDGIAPKNPASSTAKESAESIDGVFKKRPEHYTVP